MQSENFQKFLSLSKKGLKKTVWIYSLGIIDVITATEVILISVGETGIPVESQPFLGCPFWGIHFGGPPIVTTPLIKM
mgnify:CR=1